MSNTLEKYCLKKAFCSGNTITPSAGVNPISICIPVYNEYPGFFSTLRSLHLSSAFSESMGKNGRIPVSIIVCVNSRSTDERDVRENNAKMLYELERLSRTEYTFHPLLNLIVLDHSSDSCCFPSHEGVGLARKICMDYAVIHGARVLACLDADTLVSSSYISCLQFFYMQNYGESAMKEGRTKEPLSWALCGFNHQKSENTEQERAVRMYENYLLEHSARLFFCQTPYYPVALGPTIICTSYAYASCAGMNTRCAGEDFYFLQSLIKISIAKRNYQVEYLLCRVYPSSRLSSRVLFGTGKKIEEIMNGNECSAFKDQSYEVLEKFISIFHSTKKENPAEFFREVSLELPCIIPFLEKDGFFSDWLGIYEVHQKSVFNLESAFHNRFDALKIIRLFHFLEKTMR